MQFLKKLCYVDKYGKYRHPPVVTIFFAFFILFHKYICERTFLVGLTDDIVYILYRILLYYACKDKKAEDYPEPADDFESLDITGKLNVYDSIKKSDSVEEKSSFIELIVDTLVNQEINIFE